MEETKVEEKKKRASRLYITVQTTKEEKELFRKASAKSEFKTISKWFRWLAYKDMSKK